MNVLVTGGCGFIGSHVCEYYAKEGANVISYDNMTKYELDRTGYAAKAARLYNWNFLKKIGVKPIKGDILNSKELIKSAKNCDYIVHTAAQPAMTISIEDLNLDFSTNVQGTLNVLQTARKYDIPVVHCSTIHVYGNKINHDLVEKETRYEKEPPLIDEKHPLLEGTITPLHASKRSAEIYVQTFIDTYGLKAAAFRLTGLYGTRQFGGEDHGWVANFVIRTILDKEITIYGTGKQVRDILYATDVANAFDAFYKSNKPGIYNIGGGFERSISLIECIKLIEEITEIKPTLKFSNNRLGDLQYFISDISKAQEQLGWSPNVYPKEGVKNLVEWVKENKKMFIS